jgi:hypothetical protein
MSEQPMAKPSAVARELFRAIAEERWTDAATFIDPEDVRSRYDLAARTLRGEVPTVVIHQAPHRVGQIQMPLAIRSRASGFGTLEELEAVTPEEFMGRIISRLMGRRVFRGAKSDPTSDANPVLQVLRVVIGESHETETLAHVVYRRILQAPDRARLLEPISVVTLRKTAPGWRVPGPNRLTDRASTGVSGIRVDEGPWLA